MSTILVIDDSLTIRKLTELALGGAGHTVQLAASAGDGIALAQRVVPDLILLDHILPDRRGSEVCAALAADPRTARIPLLVMSAKNDDIRPLFRSQPAVVDFLAKPFTPGVLVQLVAQVLGRRDGGTGRVQRHATDRHERREPGTAGFSAAGPVAEAAARAVFLALHDRLAQLPAFASEQAASGATPAPFFARKLLTPDAMIRVVEGIAPLLPQPAAAEPVAPAPFSGDTAWLPLLSVLRIVGTQGATGELLVGGTTSLFYERGELVLVLPHGREAAAALQRTHGLSPVPEPAEATGYAPAAHLLTAQADADAARAAARRHGIDHVVGLADGQPQPFTWHDQPPLPPVVAQVGSPIPYHQLLLGRLRRVDDWSVVEADITSLDQVCGRTADLAPRLRRLELDAVETAVLREVDGRRPVRAIVERTRLSTFEVFHALYRLIQVHVVSASAPAAQRPLPPVVCGGQDLLPPLARHLAALGIAAPLGATPDSAGADGAADHVAAGRARVVLLDARTGDGPALEAVRRLRQRLESAHALVLALIDRPDLGRQAVLGAAGIDRVLVAPLPVRDLLLHLT